MAASITVTSFAPHAAARSPERTRPIPGRYIVVLNSSVGRPGEVARAQTDQANGSLRFVYRNALKGYSVALSESAARALSRDPRVAYIEPDVRGGVAAQTIPTGIRRTFASGNASLGINEIDDIRADVDVAVLDSGVDYQHPDLNVVSRTDCSNGATRAGECIDGSGTDVYGHGTHVAGTIAALDNGFGVTGMAPGARLWAVRVLDSGGSGDLSEYIAGIDWVTAHAEAIEVANSSLRYFVTSSQAFTEAMNASIAAGVVHVAAAGNENEAVRYVPGNHPNVITVSAIADYDGRAGGEGFWTCEDYGLDDRKASFSDYGSTVDITAPGVCIYSTLPGNQYGYESGTSMAAPHVSGAAALLAVRSNPNSQSDVTAIRNTLVNEGNLGWTDTSGDGIQEPLLDVGDPAVFLLLGAPVVTTSPASGVTSTGATLNGVVNPSGFSTSYHFEYGLTTAYGTNAPVPDGSIGSTLYAAHLVSQSISGLQPKTTYHYRLVASNSRGRTNGSDMTFTTAASWVAHSLTFPSGVTQEALYGVGCSSSTTCTAVGHDFNGTWGAHAESGWGSGWAFQTGVTRNPGPKNGNLVGSSCPSTTWCMTVGTYGNSSGKLAMMAQVKNGSTWTLYNLGIPSGASQAELKAVSCTSSSFCMAVGYKMVSGDDKPFAMTFNGSTWTDSGAVTATNASLRGVSCPTSTYCVAVGSTGGSALAEVWRSGAWSTTSAVVLPAGGSGYVLNSISCVSSTWCLTVGTYVTGSGNRAIASRWDGVLWHEVANLTWAVGTSPIAYGVSCVSTTKCFAVGTSSGQPFADVYDGFTPWSTMPLGVPPGATGGELRGISCVSSIRCEASGWSYFGGTPTGMMETYS